MNAAAHAKLELGSGKPPPYSHFVSELPRKFLKEFHVVLEFDERRRFTGLVLWKPTRKPDRKRSL